VLAPSTRFGYFIYPAAMILWLLVSQAGRRSVSAPDPEALTIPANPEPLTRPVNPKAFTAPEDPDAFTFPVDPEPSHLPKTPKAPRSSPPPPPVSPAPGGRTIL
jgi:hypothetical protein